MWKTLRIFESVTKQPYGTAVAWSLAQPPSARPHPPTHARTLADPHPASMHTLALSLPPTPPPCTRSHSRCLPPHLHAHARTLCDSPTPPAHARTLSTARRMAVRAGEWKTRGSHRSTITGSATHVACFVRVARSADHGRDTARLASLVTA